MLLLQLLLPSRLLVMRQPQPAAMSLPVKKTLLRIKPRAQLTVLHAPVCSVVCLVRRTTNRKVSWGKPHQGNLVGFFLTEVISRSSAWPDCQIGSASSHRQAVQQQVRLQSVQPGFHQLQQPLAVAALGHSPATPEGGIEAEVVEARSNNVLTEQQSILFLNKGRADGVAPGDVFELWRTPEARNT